MKKVKHDSPQRQIANFIDRAYAKDSWFYRLPRQTLDRYHYCGQWVHKMSFEEASNIVMTKLVYLA